MCDCELDSNFILFVFYFVLFFLYLGNYFDALSLIPLSELRS